MIKKFVKCFAFGSCLVLGMSNGDCWGMHNGYNTGDSDSDSSSRSSTSSSLSEEWIDNNRKLIDEAKYNEGAFRELISKLQSDDMVFIYDQICDNYWFNQHLYDTCHDSVKFYGGVCEHQTCDF